MKNLTSNAGRIIFSIPFLVFGLFHFMNGGDMAGWMPAWLPGALFFVYLSGAALIAAGVSIIARIYTALATRLLAVLLLLIILMLHVPGMMSGDEQMAMTSMSMLLKDTGLLGAALYMSAQFKK